MELTKGSFHLQSPTIRGTFTSFMSQFCYTVFPSSFSKCSCPLLRKHRCGSNISCSSMFKSISTFFKISYSFSRLLIKVIKKLIKKCELKDSTLHLDVFMLLRFSCLQWSTMKVQIQVNDLFLF